MRVPGGGRMVISGEGEGARELFAGERENFGVARPNMVEPLLGSGSLIMMDGERHRRERALLGPMFRGERMRAYGSVVQDVTRREVEGWRAGEVVDARAVGEIIALRVIVRAVFGVEGGELGERFVGVTRRLFKGYTAMLVMPAYRKTVGRLGAERRLRRGLAEFDGLLREEISRRLESGVEGREDILSLLLSSRNGVVDGDLLDELRTMLVAGHETTATSLAWALYHLYREPELARRLVDEVAAVGERPGAEELVALPYLGAVCQEALRLHPVVPMVARQVLAPWRFRGIDLVPGDTAAVATSLLHHNSEVWEEPFGFRPERFLGRKVRPFEYAPFGGGHRRCVGAAFGEYEMRVVLGTLVSAAVFSMSERERRRRVPRAVPGNITLGPSRALRLVYEGPSDVSERGKL
jgi:cytochrome P450 family 110